MIEILIVLIELQLPYRLAEQQLWSIQRIGPIQDTVVQFRTPVLGCVTWTLKKSRRPYVKSDSILSSSVSHNRIQLRLRRRDNVWPILWRSQDKQIQFRLSAASIQTSTVRLSINCDFFIINYYRTFNTVYLNVAPTQNIISLNLVFSGTTITRTWNILISQISVERLLSVLFFSVT